MMYFQVCFKLYNTKFLGREMTTANIKYSTAYEIIPLRGFFGSGGVPGGVPDSFLGGTGEPGSFDFLDQIFDKSPCTFGSKIFLSFQIPTSLEMDLTVFGSKLRAVKCSRTFFRTCPNSFENSGAFLREFRTTSFAKYRKTSFRSLLVLYSSLCQVETIF